MIELRHYQRDMLAGCKRVIAAGQRRPLLVAPTGSGKTVIATAVIQNACTMDKRVLVLAHTREIIKQTSAKLFAHGIDHGVIQAGFMTRPSEPVQVASIQTLWARAVRARRMLFPSADVLTVDEAHHCPAATYGKIVAAYPNAVLIGLTANVLSGRRPRPRRDLRCHYRMPAGRRTDRATIPSQDARLRPGRPQPDRRSNSYR
jgi:DNA repair protein RadD